MASFAGVKLSNMAKSKASLKPDSVGKLSPDPYSYDHRITLDQDAANKLKLGATPNVGDVFHVMGEGHVTHVSQNASGDGKSMSIGMQLKKLGMKKKGAMPKKAGVLDAVNKGISDANEG